MIEDKQRGLVAQVRGSAEDEAVNQVLGGFIWSWERAGLRSVTGQRRAVAAKAWTGFGALTRLRFN